MLVLTDRPIELVFKPLNLYYIVGAFKVIHSTIGVFQTDEIFTPKGFKVNEFLNEKKQHLLLY